MYTDPVSVHSITNCFHCCGILYIDNKKAFFFSSLNTMSTDYVSVH